MELDAIDKHILNLLQVDSKITNVSLAQKIKLSPAATLERVKKLEESAIITQYTAQVDYPKLGFGLNLMAALRLQKTTADHVTSLKLTIDKIAYVTQCYQVVGDFDFVLIVHAKNMYSYQITVVEKLYMLPFVEAIKTLGVTELIKNKPLHL